MIERRLTSYVPHTFKACVIAAQQFFDEPIKDELITKGASVKNALKIGTAR